MNGPLLYIYPRVAYNGTTLHTERERERERERANLFANEKRAYKEKREYSAP